MSSLLTFVYPAESQLSGYVSSATTVKDDHSRPDKKTFYTVANSANLDKPVTRVHDRIGKHTV